MKNKISLIIFFFVSFQLNAQINWSEDVASIIYDKCVECHRPQGIAPYSFTTYQDAYDFRYFIQDAISSGQMPPWLPDQDYRHFADEFFLTQDEEQKILDWVNQGAPSGDLNIAPNPPSFVNGSNSLLESIDYTVAIEPYTLQSNSDEYRWFVIPTNFSETVYVNKIEVFAGLKNIVHHADLSYDLSGNSLANDLADPLPGFNNSTGGPSISHYMNAWQPGGNIASFPENWGIAVPPGADFLIEIHYGPGGIGQIDSTIMNLQFVAPENIERAVNVAWLLSDSAPILQDGPLTIPANTIKTFHQETEPLSEPMSLISICPHMHYLGKSYKVWAETPGGTIIPLIDIPQWDFNWQRYYTYPYIEYLPVGTTIHSEGVYDNTDNNPNNPSDPPVDVSRGLKTTDEMFLCYFIYTDYEIGDENIFMGDTVTENITSSIFNPNIETINLNLFPNPSSSLIYSDVEIEGEAAIEIINVDGKIIHQTQVNNIDVILKNGIHVSHLKNGLHYLKIKYEDKIYLNSFVKIK